MVSLRSSLDRLGFATVTADTPVDCAGAVADLTAQQIVRTRPFLPIQPNSGSVPARGQEHPSIVLPADATRSALPTVPALSRAPAL